MDVKTDGIFVQTNKYKPNDKADVIVKAETNTWLQRFAQIFFGGLKIGDKQETVKINGTLLWAKETVDAQLVLALYEQGIIPKDIKPSVEDCLSGASLNGKYLSWFSKAIVKCFLKMVIL